MSPPSALRTRHEAGDAQRRLDKGLELGLELRAQLVERAGDEALVDGADDLRMLLGELEVRTSSQPDLAAVSLRGEALLVEHAHDLGHCRLVRKLGERRAPRCEVAA